MKIELVSSTENSSVLFWNAMPHNRYIFALPVALYPPFAGFNSGLADKVQIIKKILLNAIDTNME